MSILAAVQDPAGQSPQQPGLNRPAMSGTQAYLISGRPFQRTTLW